MILSNSWLKLKKKQKPHISKFSVWAKFQNSIIMLKHVFIFFSHTAKKKKNKRWENQISNP